MQYIGNSGNFSAASKKYSIPRSTLQDAYSKYTNNQGDVEQFSKHRTQRQTLLTEEEEEEEAVVQYCLWASDRGMNETNMNVKARIRETHATAVERGESRQKINDVCGPSAKFMRSFYKRHPALSKRTAERVDRGRINMANDETIAKYFELLKTSLVKGGIMQLDSDGNVLQESILKERIYLADETGWGANTKTKKVIGLKGAKHVYNRKSNDESHKSLMLGICGNGDLFKVSNHSGKIISIAR